MQESHGVIVIGAGPAGMMAAGQAALTGAKVLLLEKMDRPGKKLRLTGGGHCNFTNSAPLREFLLHFGAHQPFLKTVFSQFFSRELIAFFKQLGVTAVTEKGGRVLPASDQAQDIIDALQGWLLREHVTTHHLTAVNELIIDKGSVRGVISEGAEYPASAVIIATGGRSYVQTGSSGDGFALAQASGHALVPPYPALVPLVTKGDIAKSLQGVSLRDIALGLYVDNKKVAKTTGEMLFTHYGLSGPAILSLSRVAVTALANGKAVSLSIDMLPQMDERELDKYLVELFNSHGRQQCQTMLKVLLQSKMVPVCAAAIGVPADRNVHQITAEQRKRLRLWLKDLRIEISGHRGYAEAMVTTGGVSLENIDANTMQSRIVKGLYFCGEVLDVDADTGGYNIQAAFSTGWIAGRSAATFVSQGQPTA